MMEHATTARPAAGERAALALPRSRNDKRTEAVRLDLGKWVHRDLQSASEAGVRGKL